MNPGDVVEIDCLPSSHSMDLPKSLGVLVSVVPLNLQKVALWKVLFEGEVQEYWDFQLKLLTPVITK